MSKQKTNLDFKTAGFWPTPMKLLAYAFSFFAVLGLSWFLYFSSQYDRLVSLQGREETLKGDFERLQAQANNLPLLRQELANINDLLRSLILRLPNQNEIPQLVTNVSQAAIASSLEAELFEPQEETRHDFYAEKRINVRYRGQYNELGSFFSEIASQPRLVAVSVESMKVELAPEREAPAISGNAGNAPLVESGAVDLIFTGSVRTYRYLSEEEEAAAVAAAQPAATGTRRRR